MDPSLKKANGGVRLRMVWCAVAAGRCIQQGIAQAEGGLLITNGPFFHLEIEFEYYRATRARTVGLFTIRV